MPRDQRPGGKNVQRPRQTSVGQGKTHAASGVFARPLEPATAPLARGQRAAKQKVERAQRRLPERPTPTIPVLKRYTPAQTRVAQDLVTKSRRAQVPAGPNRVQRMNELDQELQQDPRSRARLEGARAAALGRADAAAAALASVYGVRGTRGQRVTAGRALLRAQQARDRVKAGPEHTRVGIPMASIDLTSLNNTIGSAVHDAAGAQGRQFGTFLADEALPFAGRAGKDAVTFPYTAAQGLYEIGAAGVEAAQGDTARGTRIIGGLDEGFLGQLLIHGDADAAMKAFSEHPLYSTLEVTGTGQVAGRLAGAGMRSGALGAAAKRAASTKRADLELLPGTNQRVQRSYSPNVFVKALQVAAEREAARLGHDPNVARDSVIPFRGRGHALNRAVDEFAAQGEGLRRRGRTEIGKEAARVAPVRHGAAGAARRAGPDATRRERAAAAVARAPAAADRAAQRAVEGTALPGRAGAARVERDVVLAAVEGRLHGPKTFKKDLQRERDRLDAVYRAEKDTMSASTRRENRRQVQAMDRVLKDPKALANAGEVFRARDEYRATSGQLEKDLIARKALDPDQALAAKVRPYAVAVMGARHSAVKKSPEEMAARHGEAKAAEAAAKERLAQASAAVEKAARAKNPEAVKAARAEKRAAAAEFKQARRDRVASNPKKYALGLVDEDGNRITTQQILDHMRANPEHGDGVGSVHLPAFVSHRKDTRGARSFFVNWFDSRKTSDAKGSRTGEATRTGGHAADFRALEEHLVHQQGVVDAIDIFDSFVGQFGMKRPDGAPFTWAQAVKAAEEMTEATGRKMVPVRAAPARYDDAAKREILEGQGAAAMANYMDSLVEGRISQALTPDPSDKGAANVVLMDEGQVKRFRDHQAKSTGPGAKLGQAFSSAFRGAVLPLSTKWLTGNVAEAHLRMLANGINPVTDTWRGRRVMAELRKLDEKAWREADARLRGGLLYGSGERLGVHNTAKDFEGTALESSAAALAFAARVPVIRQTLGGIKVFQQAVFTLNRGFERYAQTAVIGKQARREVQEMQGSWLKALALQERAAKEVASGLTETSTQVRFARAMDDTLGKYDRFSPSTRRFIQAYAPFLPWFLNAAKFVGHTLPVKHPAKTALLMSVERVYDKQFEEARESRPPGSLGAALEREDGGLVDVARYTPFGAFTQGPEILVEPVLPQISSAAQILAGRNFSGRKLQQESGEDVEGGKRIALALYSLFESTLPGISIGRRLQEHGESPFDDSTIFDPKTKPGTSYGSSAANRVFNPLRPTFLNPPNKAGKLLANTVPMDAADEADLEDLDAQDLELDAVDLEDLEDIE